MVMHKKKPVAKKSQYWVMTKVCEPKYEAERKFVQTEVAFAERKIAEHHASLLRDWSLPALGFYHRKAWQKYAHALERYEHQLGKYQAEVGSGVLPVKFAVYNTAETEDSQVNVQLHVKGGHIDADKKPPERPERLDGRGKDSKFGWPKLGSFSRSRVKITAQTVVAEFSTLGANDGAVLVNQLVHLHSEADTRLTYEISSRKVKHETGEVEMPEA